jgi:hypothetical protein
MLLATLASYLGAVASAQEGWTIARVVQTVKAREGAIEKLEAILEISQPIPSSYKNYYEANQLSIRLMAEARGVSKLSLPATKSYEAQNYKSPDPYRIHYRRNSQGMQRSDWYRIAEGWPTQRIASYVFDGHTWWSLVGKQATLSDGVMIPRDGRYLGLDFDWGTFTRAHPVKSHSLSGAVNELHALGLAEIVPLTGAGDSGLIGLLVRHAEGPDVPSEANVLVQHLLVFNPDLGMAPVRYETRRGQKTGDGFIDVHPPGWFRGTWDDFEQVAPGLWLPRKFQCEGFQSVLLPKTGETYPPGFNFEKATYRDFRVESFLVSETRVRVIKVKINQDCDLNTFKPDFPKEVVLHDDINDKTYQTRDLLPVTLEDDMRRALAASRKSGYGVWLWIVLVNLLLLGAFGGWFWLRRRRGKMGPPNSAAQPSGQV